MGAISSKPRKNRRDADLRDSVSLLQSARDLSHIGRFMPKDKELQDFIGEQLISWSKQDTSLDIDQFFSEKDLGPIKFYRACETNEHLDECLEVALANIASRIASSLKDSHEFKMKAYPMYASLHRKQYKEKMDAEKNQVVTTIYKEQKIGIPVFGKKSSVQESK